MINIIEGEVEVRPQGTAALARLGPGEYVGELAALSGGPRSASVYAVGPVWALSIDSGVLTNLILDRPEIGRQMLTALAQRLADAVIIDKLPRSMIGKVLKIELRAAYLEYGQASKNDQMV